jgi:manganese efflux pump family protein
MDLITLLLIAVALALDCFAVAVAAGTRGMQRFRSAARIAIAFGVFQAGMPALGWLAGRSVMALIAGIDHWVAFALLSIVGLRMVHGGVSPDPASGPIRLDTPHLLILAVATSIDALAVGASFALLDTGILVPCLVIGIAAFIISFLGALLGGVTARRWGKTMEVLGGIVLTGIGVQILISHLFT